MAQVIDFGIFRRTKDLLESSEEQTVFDLVDDFAVALYNRMCMLIMFNDKQQFDRDFTIGLESIYAALERQLDIDHPFHPLLDDSSIDLYQEDELTR